MGGGAHAAHGERTWAAERASLPPPASSLACAPTAPPPCLLPQGLLDPKSLEDLTGLTLLHAASEAAIEAWEGSDEEEGGVQAAGGGSGGGGEDEWCEL